MKFLTLLLLSLLTAPVFGQSGSQLKWKTLTREKYKIKHPSSWTVDTTKYDSGIELFISQPLVNDEDIFEDNISVEVRDLKGSSTTLDEFVKARENEIKEEVSNYQLIKSARSKLQGHAFHELEFIATHGVMEMHTKQYIFIRNGEAFIVSLFAVENDFKPIKEVATAILNSFVLK